MKSAIMTNNKELIAKANIIKDKLNEIDRELRYFKLYKQQSKISELETKRLPLWNEYLKFRADIFA
jgi:hypothetical protein